MKKPKNGNRGGRRSKRRGINKIIHQLTNRKKTIENIYYNGKSQPSPTMYDLLFNSKDKL